MLRRLENCQINQVLSTNFQIWSPGLDRSRYQHYQWWQLNCAWGRRHLEYFGYFTPAGKLVASCKRYRLAYQSRGRAFNMAGIGAVFVPEDERGHAYGSEMLELIDELCCEDGFDALLLNSDINPQFYARLGYALFAAESFSVSLSDNWLAGAINYFSRLAEPLPAASFIVRDLEITDIEEMCRHHGRWLTRQAFGLQRSAAYWHYKLGRERFLHQYSKLNWPQLTIISCNYGQFVGGYALLEQAGSTMRILEVIGPEQVCQALWAQILHLAQKRQAKKIHGWQVTSPPVKGLSRYPRDWSFPMICPLKEEIEDELLDWCTIDKPSMLELDHF